MNETGHRNYDGPLSGRCYCDFSLISAVGENIHWYQHNSSSGISIFLENTSHFIPIQWHSKLSILDTEQLIYFNILLPYRPRKGGDQSYSGQSKVIKLKYIPWLRGQTFRVSNSSIVIWTKDVAVSHFNL